MEDQKNLPSKQTSELQVRDTGLTAKCIADNTEKISIAFPTLSAGFYKLLFDRVKVYQITDRELTKAVNYVIDTFNGFGNPKIGAFISYVRPDGIVEIMAEKLSPEEIEKNRKKEEEEYDQWVIENNKKNEAWLKDMERQEQEYETRNSPPKGF
jgi:hypothetical protein